MTVTPVRASVGRVAVVLPVLAGALAGALAGTTIGCYHAEPLDPRALLAALRQPDASQPGLGPSGAAPIGATPGLSEERSVALALLWNRDLRAFRLTRGVAEGEIVSAGALASPELRMELTHLQKLNAGQLGWDVRLTWQPPQPGVRAGRQGAAKAHLEAIDHEVSEREFSLTCDVRIAHANLIALDDQIRVAQDTVANRRRLGEVITRRVEKGATTRFDLDLVRLSLASATRAEGERHLARSLAAGELVRLLGVGAPGAAVRVTGQLGEDASGAPLPSQSELEDRALVNRPAVAAAAARYQASEETLRAEQAARWPWFRLASAPRVRRNEFFGVTTDLVVGIDLVLPIFDTNRGRAQSAISARAVARAEVTAALGSIRDDIARARAAIEAQRAILHRLHVEIEPLLAEHDRLLAVAAQAAELDLPALIASEDLVLASRIEVIAARLELRKAEVAIDRAVGAHLHLSAPSEPK